MSRTPPHAAMIHCGDQYPVLLGHARGGLVSLMQQNFDGFDVILLPHTAALELARTLQAMAPPPAEPRRIPADQEPSPEAP